MKNWCRDYKPDKNPDVDMCANYEWRGKAICLKGNKAGVFCHIRNQNLGMQQEHD